MGLCYCQLPNRRRGSGGRPQRFHMGCVLPQARKDCGWIGRLGCLRFLPSLQGRCCPPQAAGSQSLSFQHLLVQGHSAWGAERSYQPARTTVSNHERHAAADLVLARLQGSGNPHSRLVSDVADPLPHSRYYEDLVDELLASGITPMITIFHWDLPQALYDRYGGFLNKQEYTQDYANYARLLFSRLGPKVKFWITYNEPWCSAILGYSLGVFAPGHTSDRTKSPKGDSSIEPWIVGHNIILAHATAVKIYREEFKPWQHGTIGITLNGDSVEPFDTSSPRDLQACERKLEFSIGWFADPIYKGHYPASMEQQLGSRLPAFTDEERALVHGSNDAYFMNTYTTDYIRARQEPPAPEDFIGNCDALKRNVHGESIGPETQSPWLRPHPAGFRKLLNWISHRYGHPPIYVTENGTSVKGENDLPIEEILVDDFRAAYFNGYINEMAKAHDDGVDVRGYMAWSLLDNFEWAEGFETRFGVTFVDYAGGQKRHPKKSARVIGELFATLCEG